MHLNRLRWRKLSPRFLILAGIVIAITSATSAARDDAPVPAATTVEHAS
jgi:hypothetical protein